MKIAAIIRLLAQIAAMVLAVVVLAAAQPVKLIACELEVIMLWVCVITSEFERR